MKGGRQRQEFQQQQQRNRIIAQLNQLKGVGYSTEEIKAAGKNAWLELGGPNIVHNNATGYTFRDGETLSSIASKHGTTVPDILNANPDMTAPKTGMVINIPNNYNVNMRGRGYNQMNQTNGTKDDVFGGGLPSNAALGGLTTNAVNQTPNNYNAAQRGRGFGQPVQQPQANNLNAFPSLGQSSQLPAQPNLAPVQPKPQTGPWNPFAFNSPIQQYSAQSPLAGLFNNPSAEIQKAMQTQPVASAPAIKAAGSAFAPTFRTKDDYLPTQIAALVNMDNYHPSDYELKYLEKYGMITKTPEPAYAGGGGYRRFHHGGGGGGRGGGRGSGTGKQKAPATPAFASGAGFNGLVNWRI